MPSKSEYEKALDIIEELHPSASVLSKATSMVRDPDVEVSDLEKLLRTDAPLTSDVLRLSNSAYYSYATPARDLASAISRIGFDELTKLIGLSISKRMFAQDLKHYNMRALDYWSETVTTALMMEVVAKFAHVDSQEAYTVGLLRTVGKVVIEQVLDIFGSEDMYDGSMSVTEWEKSILGFNHSFAGAIILKRWDFDSDFTNPILGQYKPEKDPDEEDPMINCLYFSHKMVQQVGYGFVNEDVMFDDWMEDFLSKYAVDEGELLDSLITAAENFQIIKRDLGIE